MSVTNRPMLPKPLTEAPAAKAAPKLSGLPPFRPLVLAAFAANVPLLSWLLIVGRLENALSLSSGFFVGIALYGSLHLFVGRGLEPLFAGVRGQAKPNIGGAKSLFVVLLPLKYLVIGGVMFLLLRGGHLSLLWFVIGFLTTQISVTAAAVPHLAKQRN